MTLDEWERFERNFDTSFSSFTTGGIKNFLLTCPEDFENFIAEAFLWSDSYEGEKFWSAISDRTFPIC